MDFKDIHIGSLIKKAVLENEINSKRICNFLKCTEDDIEQMYIAKSLDSEIILRWSKLLEYDFFRIYSQHLIFFSPPKGKDYISSAKTHQSLPVFRKNIYTKEIIDFILKQIENNEKTKKQVIEIYKIPKTTLYKWISKYKK